MWMPTHVQVTVQRASGLLTKGKHNTNDCFVTILLGKTKYQTSIKEKAEPSVEWHEECELPIPDQGNKAEIILTALHRNFMGVDEFLGRIAIPLNSLDIYERPKNKWYPLESKPGKEKKKERGRLEVKISFTVKSGSLTNLSKKEKHKSSLSKVAQSVGGSLLSLGSSEKRKGIKKIAKSIGSKMHLKGKKKDEDDDNSSSVGSVGSLHRRNNTFSKFGSRQVEDDPDPGVVSEEEDEFTFDDLSHKSSASSLSQTASHVGNNIIITPATENVSPEVKETPSPRPSPLPRSPRVEKKDEWESKLFGKQSRSPLKAKSSESLNRRSWESSKLSSHIEEEGPLETETKEDNLSAKSTPEAAQKNKKEEKESMFSKLKNFRKDKNEVLDFKADRFFSNSSERIIIGGEKESPKITRSNHISNELLEKFEGKTREDLVLKLCDLQHDLDVHKKKLKDLEDYIDDLLLRVMETQPRILQNPYISCKLAHKNSA